MNHIYIYICIYVCIAPWWDGVIAPPPPEGSRQGGVKSKDLEILIIIIDY
jgi:hypothetical protein